MADYLSQIYDALNSGTVASDPNSIATAAADSKTQQNNQMNSQSLLKALNDISGTGAGSGASVSPGTGFVIPAGNPFHASSLVSNSLAANASVALNAQQQQSRQNSSSGDQDIKDAMSIYKDAKQFIGSPSPDIGVTTEDTSSSIFNAASTSAEGGSLGDLLGGASGIGGAGMEFTGGSGAAESIAGASSAAEAGGLGDLLGGAEGLGGAVGGEAGGAGIGSMFGDALSSAGSYLVALFCL